ncbi:MAG: putative metal-binding motif-containing protein, partial [Deltaproteobacteria bacterium]|nr:putative metal-binding motif-containing protein [Deltaproteobacteria bacterium]
CPPVCQDNDKDGYGNPGVTSCPNGPQTDCNDTDSSVHPGATEVPYNGKDDDCNLTTLDDDFDGDGYPIATDCNDNDPLVHPGAIEICDDLVDNDCDGDINCDDSDCSGNPVCLTCTDNDGDGYYFQGGICGPVDCNDNDASVHPGATEICDDGQDNDCDGDLNCEDTDCAGKAACLPTAVALAKTISVNIPGYKCFRIQIENPGPHDVQVSQDISWHQTAPSDVQTTLLPGNMTVPAGQTRTVFYPCFNVGAGSQPGDYSLDILWTGQDAAGNPINLNTDPTLHLYYPTPLGASTGGVGGVGLPVNKLDLVSSLLGRFMLLAGIAMSIIVWRKKRRTL